MVSTGTQNIHVGPTQRLPSIVERAYRIDPTAVTGIGVDLSALKSPEERELMKALLDYPKLIESAADLLEPHLVANFLHDTAGKIHLWYHKDHVLNEPEPIMQARLVLARASQLVLRNGLDLLGISAPERM